jgi:hypothetical protein
MYSIPFIIKVLKEIHINGLTLKSLQGYIADVTCTGTVDGYIELSISRIYSFKNLILEAIAKLWATNYYQELTDWLKRCTGNKNELIKTFLEFSQEFECRKVSVPIQGPCALSYDFYLQSGSYCLNSPFFFGTPSQHRDTKKGGSPKNKKDRPRCILRI